MPINWVKRLQRARAAIAALFAVTAITVPLGAFAWIQRGEAIRQSQEAVRQNQEAIRQKAEAQKQTLLAQQALADARTERQQALAQEEKAEKSAEQARQNEQLAEENAREAAAQTEFARKQTALAEERRQAAERARVAESEQRARAETQTGIATEQRARAEQQTQVAQTQTIFAQINALKAFVLAQQPLEAMVAAVRAWQPVIEAKRLDTQIVTQAQATLTQRVYDNWAFNLNRPKAQDIAPYPFQGFLEKNQLKAHSASVWSVAFSPDGHTLASASSDQTVKLWTLDPARLMAWSCNWLRDYLLYNPDGQKAAADGACQDYLPDES